MKKWFFIVLGAAITFSACSKKKDDCSTTAPTTVASSSETAYLQNYLTANSITATQINGMFYSFTSAGSGESPNLCNTISVIYTGKLITGTTDGAVFDSSNGAAVSLSMSNLIAGWQLVLPLVKTGGVVTLYIPPSLGYGASASGPIPGNSYLKFNVQLNSVQ